MWKWTVHQPGLVGDNLGRLKKTLDELADALHCFVQKEDADGDGDPTNEIGLINNTGTFRQTASMLSNLRAAWLAVIPTTWD